MNHRFRRLTGTDRALHVPTEMKLAAHWGICPLWLIWPFLLTTLSRFPHGVHLAFDVQVAGVVGQFHVFLPLVMTFCSGACGGHRRIAASKRKPYHESVRYFGVIENPR